MGAGIGVPLSFAGYYFATSLLKIVINESAWVRAGIDNSTNADDVVMEISLNKIVVEEVYNPQDIMLVEDAIQVVEEWTPDLPEDVQSPRGTSQPTTANFFSDAICKCN